MYYVENRICRCIKLKTVACVTQHLMLIWLTVMRRRCEARALGCCLFGPAARERYDVNPSPDWTPTLILTLVRYIVLKKSFKYYIDANGLRLLD